MDFSWQECRNAILFSRESSDQRIRHTSPALRQTDSLPLSHPWCGSIIGICLVPHSLVHTTVLTVTELPGRNKLLTGPYIFEYIHPYLQLASLIAQLVKTPPAIRRPSFDSMIRKICWRRDRLPSPIFLGFLYGSAGRESTCNVGDLGMIPGLGRSPGEGKGYPLQYSGLENFMDCIVHGVAKSRTWLSNFHFHIYNCTLVHLTFTQLVYFCLFLN